jgi:hypothetical protein
VQDEYALVTDACTSALDALQQHCLKNASQPLTFFFKKLNSAWQKYGAYDCELLAIYKAVKHFRHMLEARHFIFTYAFLQKRDKFLQRQFSI